MQRHLLEWGVFYSGVLLLIGNRDFSFSFLLLLWVLVSILATRKNPCDQEENKIRKREKLKERMPFRGLLNLEIFGVRFL